MRKNYFFPVIFALFTACSSPLLEWIETEPDTSTQIADGPETTPVPGQEGSEPNFYKMPSNDKEITHFSFGILDEEDNIKINLSNDDKWPITVILPAGSDPSNLPAPSITFKGKSMSPESGVFQDFSSPKIYTVTAEDNSKRDYRVEVIVKDPGSAEIKWFDLRLKNNYLAEGEVVQGSPGTIEIHVPSGTSLNPITAEIAQTGKTLTASNIPGSHTGTTITLTGDFSGTYPYTYTYAVTSEDNSVTKNYNVSVIVDLSSDTGILDFAVTAHKNGDSTLYSVQTVIGEKARTQPDDRRIPIVIHVPYDTDEKDMTAVITLPPGANITPLGNPIPFGNKGNKKEAVYTVMAEDGTTQDYVALVSEGPGYYYVDGMYGDDERPDIHNGGSESYPFKTLAYAVWQAAIDGIPEVRIMNDLSAANGGIITGDSAFAIDLSSVTNKTVTIASSVPGGTRTLSAASPQRVLSITGGANLTFKNINVTGGNTAGNGGGIYVGGNSTVNFTGNITGNTAKSGGGVYLEGAGTGPSDYSRFILTSGEISGNTATGNASGDPDVSLMSGGGGVYIKGNADFTLASGGTISNNTTAGAGGGVLVNGNVSGDSYHSPPFSGTEHGLIMNGGRISNNTSTSWTYPHGGGGVYVAKGFFEMAGGEVTTNAANRQGGGVFVHWGDARFTASGTSTTILNNIGTGSSKAICNRGITALTGDTTADYVYIWDHGDSQSPQGFTLTNNTQITTGIALAYSAANKNFITFADDFTGTAGGSIEIDLESHLDSNGHFVGQLEPDWLGMKIIAGTTATLNAMLSRLDLNTFTGDPSVYYLHDNYKIDVAGIEGKFAKKP